MEGSKILICGGLLFFLLFLFAVFRYKILASKISAAAKAYLEKEDYYSHFNAVLVPVGMSLLESHQVPIDWSFPKEDQSTIHRMHSLRYLDAAFLRWCKTFNPKWERLITAHILDYLHYGAERTQGVYYAWSDDSVARRVFRLSYWGYLFQNRFSGKDLALLKACVSEQAKLLTQDSFYNYNHNHGMYQDAGLIAYALFWAPDDAVKTEYLSLAKSRSEEYFDYVFTGEGVHKEHSPRYGYLISASVLPFYAEVYRETDPEFSQKCSRLSQNSGEYFAALTMPNGMLPPLGDSEKFLIEKEFWTENPHYQWAATGGRYGACPPEDMVFPESGYAVFRSSWHIEWRKAVSWKSRGTPASKKRTGRKSVSLMKGVRTYVQRHPFDWPSIVKKCLFFFQAYQIAGTPPPVHIFTILCRDL